eukprot:CAMPEP_0201913408 /NCGR_PEP_ID=MMETSP0903-20130614/3850_1 /ASSEMBLY_ACC=CAM_ASM_000552 /TAXON_ID=420261 /ORGANISM="Thalassiosira antarctica, Strain CCMP982" /LENGTH=43 /DNA_ID= /DNA_START= /DNA_END= /DNA_ORIENTATION=
MSHESSPSLLPDEIMTNNGTLAFLYTGKEEVPKDVTAVEFSPS